MKNYKNMYKLEDFITEKLLLINVEKTTYFAQIVLKKSG